MRPGDDRGRLGEAGSHPLDPRATEGVRLPGGSEGPPERALATSSRSQSGRSGGVDREGGWLSDGLAEKVKRGGFREQVSCA